MVKVITFGCRINAYESEVIKEKLSHLDDVIVVNTCAVTQEAERQCRQCLRKLRRENPTARIVATGCAVQINPQKFSAGQLIPSLYIPVQCSAHGRPFSRNLSGSLRTQCRSAACIFLFSAAASAS